MCDGLVLGAIAGNLLCAWLGWQAKRQWDDLTRQYQRYVERLEAVVQQYREEETDGR